MHEDNTIVMMQTLNPMAGIEQLLKQEEPYLEEQCWNHRQKRQRRGGGGTPVLRLGHTGPSNSFIHSLIHSLHELIRGSNLDH